MLKLSRAMKGTLAREMNANDLLKHKLNNIQGNATLFISKRANLFEPLG